MINDPIEKEVAAALDSLGIDYLHDTSGRTKGLDFYLPKWDLYIECKAFKTPRTEKQLLRDNNVIVIQGRKSAEFFNMLARGKP